VGTEMVADIIVQTDLSKHPFQLKGDSGNIYSCDSLIISTGAQAKWLGLESEKHFQGFGVSACATCDGFFFRNKDVAVIGGGNTAVEEALYLTKHAKKVKLVHRREELRAERILQQRLLNNDKIEIMWNSILLEVIGKPDQAIPEVSAMRIKNLSNGDTSKIPIDGIFVAIGHTPNTSIFDGQLKMDDDGYLITKPDSTATDIPGVFAAGDVQDHIFRQAVTAAGTGCMAALEAEKYLAEIEASGLKTAL